MSQNSKFYTDGVSPCGCAKERWLTKWLRLLKSGLWKSYFFTACVGRRVFSGESHEEPHIFDTFSEWRLCEMINLISTTPPAKIQPKRSPYKSQAMHSAATWNASENVSSTNIQRPHAQETFPQEPEESSLVVWEGNGKRGKEERQNRYKKREGGCSRIGGAKTYR